MKRRKFGSKRTESTGAMSIAIALAVLLTILLSGCSTDSNTDQGEDLATAKQTDVLEAVSPSPEYLNVDSEQPAERTEPNHEEAGYMAQYWRRGLILDIIEQCREFGCSDEEMAEHLQEGVWFFGINANIPDPRTYDLGIYANQASELVSQLFHDKQFGELRGVTINPSSFNRYGFYIGSDENRWAGRVSTNAWFAGSGERCPFQGRQNSVLCDGSYCAFVDYWSETE